MQCSRSLLSRLVLLLGLCLCATAAGGTDAAAAGAKTSRNARSGMEIQDVGVKSLDSFFSDAREIDDRLDRAQRARRQGRLGINAALGLDRSTSLEAAVTELKTRARGNLTVVMRGGVPQLAAKDVLPSDLVSAVDAVNAAAAGYAGAMKDLAGIPKRSASLVRKSRRLPKKLKSQYVDGFDPAQIPQMLKQTSALKNNVRVVKDLPRRSRHVVRGLNQDMGVLVRSFGGTWPPGGRPPGADR